ncbi:MAG: nucleotidyltransferase domain-containing protein [Nanoarchaeota archaeon]
MDKKTLLSKIKTSLNKKLHVKKIYLFGSRARGDFYEESDYDLAVISQDFAEMSFDERQKLVRPLIRKVLKGAALDVVCYTEQEYRQGKKAFLPSIIEKEGIAV